ncbi:helix-turn-helix transcriptional regulator [Actinomycetes bacterium KLBMP 9797]
MVRGQPDPDLAWWRSESIDGRPLREVLREHDFAAVFKFLKRRGWSRAALAAATGLSETRVRAICQGRQRITSYEVIERVADGLRIDRGLLGVAFDDDAGQLARPSASGVTGRDGPTGATSTGAALDSRDELLCVAGSSPVRVTVSGGEAVEVVCHDEAVGRVEIVAGDVRVQIDASGVDWTPLVPAIVGEPVLPDGTRVYALDQRRAR